MLTALVAQVMAGGMLELLILAAHSEPEREFADENGDGALESDEIVWLCGEMGETCDPVAWSLCRCFIFGWLCPPKCILETHSLSGFKIV